MAIATADDARAWIAGLPDVSRETMQQLERFASLLREANQTQNLVAASTLAEDALWTRHVLDAAQLLPLAGYAGGSWIDLGAGPGLPGIVIAILAPQWRVTLVDNRRLRCAFMQSVIDDVGITATVLHQHVERLPVRPHSVISARAFAPLPKLLPISGHLANENTLWLLPKGKNAANELSTLRIAWQKRFHVERSLTDDDASILVGRGKFEAMTR
jgi:16S rRNA (guanine527-N7)-methyltransferase